MESVTQTDHLSSSRHLVRLEWLGLQLDMSYERCSLGRPRQVLEGEVVRSGVMSDGLSASIEDPVCFSSTHRLTPWTNYAASFNRQPPFQIAVPSVLENGLRFRW